MYRIAGRYDVTFGGSGSDWPSARTGITGAYVDVSGLSSVTDVAVGDYIQVLLPNQKSFRWRITSITSTSPSLVVNAVPDGDATGFPSAYASNPIPAQSHAIVGAISALGPAIVPSFTSRQISEMLTAAVASENATESGGGAGLTPDQTEALSFIDSRIPSASSSSMTMVIGPPASNLIDSTASAGLLIVAGAPASHPNQIIGDTDLRSIIGGYDNKIGQAIASSIIGSHHSIIEKVGSAQAHSLIVGGGGHRILEEGSFSGIFDGQQCTVNGSSSTAIAAEFCNAVGTRSFVAGAIDCSIGMGGVDAGQAITSTVPASIPVGGPQPGFLINVASTASFGSTGAIVQAYCLSRTTNGAHPVPFKVPFTVEVMSATQLKLVSEAPVDWFNEPDLTTGIQIVPITPLISNNAQCAILCSDNCEITATNAGSVGITIIGSSFCYAQNHTAHPEGTLFPSHAVVVGGSGSLVQAPYQQAFGVGAKPHNSGQWSRSYGSFATTGDCQFSSYVTRLVTTDAVATNSLLPFALDGTLGQHYNLIPSKVYTIRACVTAVKTSGTAGDKSAAYEVKAHVKCDANGDVTILGQSTTVIYETNAAWNVVLGKFSGTAELPATAWDTLNQGIIHFTCTGEAAATIRWGIFCDIDEIAYA